MTPLLDKLVDARRMARRHPGTFRLSDPVDLASLAPGDAVKVCRDEERFWVTLTAVDGERLTGTVANRLVMPSNAHLFLGLTVGVEKRHVYAVGRLVEASGVESDKPEGGNHA